jgi:hypothetical protein
VTKEEAPAKSGTTVARRGEQPDAARAMQRAFPEWARWGAVAWLAFWIPVYWHFWGPHNFVYLCDIAVILGCIGIWANNTLLISSQAVSSLIVDAMWAVDAAWRAALGRHIFGGTEYLFDPSHALWLRLLSLYHVAIPVVLLWAVHRAGYDRRGWALQSGIVAAAFAAARFTPAAQNINFAFRLPVVDKPFGPAPLHVVVSILFMIFVVYWPTHWTLRKIFPAPES